MARLSEIRADLSKVEEGQWVTYSAGIELLIASTDSKKYRAERSRILKPLMRGTRRSLDPDKVVDLLKPAVAKYLLLGWRNLEDVQGKEIKYSYDQALRFFNDPALRDLYNFVLEAAGEAELFRAEETEAEAKNSKTA